jgi:uncharacterized phage protein (TIGR02220 family)
MSRVWDSSSLGGTELLCLLAIADFANDEGTAFPSVSTLAAKIRMSERNTHYLLKKLEESGELEIDRNAGPKGCNLFRVKTLQGADIAPVQPIARGGATGSAKGVQPIAPEPSLNHQEPSVESTSSKRAIEILTYLNEKARRNYRPVKANISLISARLKEGATPDECRAVIDTKVKAWSTDTKMAQYLRPATLFSATNYAQYAGELGGTRQDERRDWE